MVLESSVVKDITYCAGAQNLFVVMESGAYMYANVPLDIAALFLVSESKGKFFNRYIKNEYNCYKLG